MHSCIGFYNIKKFSSVCKLVRINIKFGCTVQSNFGVKNFKCILMDVHLPFLEMGVLVVLGLFFMNSPKKLNAPAE